MLKKYVLEHVKPDDYYARRFPNWNPSVRGNVRCIFHDDKSPSLNLALKNGGARCHASTCRKSIGNIVHFEAERLDISEKMAARKLYREFIRPTVNRKKVASYRENLMTDATYILKIKKEMGLTLATIRKFNLGLDPDSHRVTIPVYDQFGQCVNIRFYRLPSERSRNDSAKLYNLEGYGRLDLFPISSILSAPDNVPLYFMASEKEAKLATQDGLCAFTTTTGEGSWDAAWNPWFKGRTIYLVFDRDAGGEQAEKRIAATLATVAKVIPVHLPFKRDSLRRGWKDYADWRLREKHTVDELKKLSGHKVAKGSSVRKRNREVEMEAQDGYVGDSDFPKLPVFADDQAHDIIDISSRNDLLNKRIKTQGIVAAKAPNTYSVPWKFRVKVKDRPKFEYELPMGRELLRFVRASDLQIVAAVRGIIGSDRAEVEPLAYLTATEVEVIPTAVADRDVPYVVQRCFYFGERIESNVPYYIEVIPTSEIRTQETIGIITRVSPLAKSIEKFELTPEVIADLSFFQPEGEEGVWNKLVNTGNEIASRYTRIYNRLDWHLVALLTWLSPIGWRFPSEPELQRGWLNSLALGDTETGKSKVSKKLQEIFGCGVFVNAENCTYVGLVGGAIKMGSGQLMLRWGRIPLSDKQLVVLEELSGLSVEEISNMSDVRSSGIARLDKGGINSETNSRTRLLCLSNVRSARRNLSQYLFGVHAVQELIGHGEDIARFDLITTLIDREVSIDIINSGKFATVANEDMLIQEDMLRKLCQFVWSLTPEQIKFTDEAYHECLEQTKKLSAEYHPSIPVFKGGSGRYKLGRIAASIACLQFSFDSDTEGIRVTKAHVKAASRLLRLIYDKPSFGYREYSSQMFDRENVKDEAILRKAITERIPRQNLSKAVETLIHSTKFTRDELCAIAGVPFLHADQIIGVMVRERALRHGEANVWEITPAGKTFLERLAAKNVKVK